MRLANTSDELSDFTTSEDLLGRAALARRIADVVSGRQVQGTKFTLQLPGTHRSNVVGVFGGWGTGKTHLLRQVARCLVEDAEQGASTLVVTLPTWHLTHEGELGASLITRLRRKEHYARTPALDSVDWKAVMCASERVLQSMAHRAPMPADETDTSTAFATLIEALSGPNQSRVIVLVDDLDRCSPKSMVAFFEWVKLHLTAPRCTFLVALDQRAAAFAVIGRYADYLEDRHDTSFGYRYLDKLFDIDFALGVPDGLERLAVARCFSESSSTDRDVNSPLSLREAIVRMHGTDFQWIDRIPTLLELPCVARPRVVLKVCNVFRLALYKLREFRSTAKFEAQLPLEAPYWLFLLACMEYTLTPDDLVSFCAHKGPIFGSLKDGRLHDTLVAQPVEAPARQFGELLADHARKIGDARHPRTESLSLLLRIVRTKL